jgi:hypothetical protein
MQTRLGHTLLITGAFLALSFSSAFAFDPNRIVHTKDPDKLYFVVKHENGVVTVRPIDREKMPQATTVKYEEIFEGRVETTQLVADDLYMGDEEAIDDATAQQVALFQGAQGIEMRVLTLADATVERKEMVEEPAPIPDEHESTLGQFLKCVFCCTCGSNSN